MLVYFIEKIVYNKKVKEKFMKKILFLLSLFLLCGCQGSVSHKKLSENVTLSFFYIEGCSECQAFKETAIPYLEDTFGEQLKIVQYDLDDEATEPIYDAIIDSLENFDESLYGNGPFYAVEGYFVNLGYTVGDEEYLADDIKRAVEGKELSFELEGLRFMYKRS